VSGSGRSPLRDGRESRVRAGQIRGRIHDSLRSTRSYAIKSTESPEEALSACTSLLQAPGICSTLTFVVSLAWLLIRSRRIQHALSRTQRRRASAGRIDSCVAGSGYKRRRYEKRRLMSNLRTVANRPFAHLEGFFPPKRVGLAFGQLRRARWES